MLSVFVLALLHLIPIEYTSAGVDDQCYIDV